MVINSVYLDNKLHVWRQLYSFDAHISQRGKPITIQFSPISCSPKYNNAKMHRSTLFNGGHNHKGRQQHNKPPLWALQGRSPSLVVGFLFFFPQRRRSTMGIISVLCVGRLKVRRPLDRETEQLTLIPDLCDSQKKKKKKKKKEPACTGAECNTQREGGRERGRENNGPSDSAEIYMQLCTSPLSPAWCIKWIIPFTPHTGVIVCSADAPLPSLPLWSALESRHRFYLDRPADNHRPSQIGLIK